MTLTDQFHTDQDTKLTSQHGKGTVTEGSKKGKEERKPVRLYLKGKRNKTKRKRQPYLDWEPNFA